MNVVLVIMDSLRRDAVGCYGSPPPWGATSTPTLDKLALESVRFTNAYPESLPTLCARRAFYTGNRTYPFHDGDFSFRGDFSGAPGWGPIPEHQDTLAEIFARASYRTALISDLFHAFKPSKNFWRGFNEWEFIRGQEADPYKSGPWPSQDEIDRWVPPVIQEVIGAEPGRGPAWAGRAAFVRQIVMNMYGRDTEEDWFNAKVMRRAASWLRDNSDAGQFFLTVECFDPHEPWFVPSKYRQRYDDASGQDQVVSPYAELPDLDEDLVRSTRANYSGLVTMCDTWLGHLIETLESLSLMDSTLLVVASDHGHSLWERRGYIGKRNYPADPEVMDAVLLVRHPDGAGAGSVCDAFVQHHDVAATILDSANLLQEDAVDGRSFWPAIVGEELVTRDHITIGWGGAVTVVTEEWWLNVKVDGTGAFLYDRRAADPFAANVAAREPEVVRDLFRRAVDDAGGSFPDYVLAQAAGDMDAPGCSAIAAN